MHISVRFASHRSAVLLALIALVCGALLAACHNHGIPPVQAGELQPIQLPKPEITGGMPLMQALAKRHTTRAFLDKPLPPQTLSNLLWAAFGVNRPREVKAGLGRTAPSAMNKQDVELDVVLASGVYVYEAEANRLRPVLAGDLRAQLSPPAAAHAAVTIVYVADAKDGSAQVDTGFIGQNVYLFAASEGLNAWFYAIHGQDVAAVLKLPEGRQPLYEQSIGYPPQ
jgi:nitroreductase